MNEPEHDPDDDERQAVSATEPERDAGTGSRIPPGIAAFGKVVWALTSYGWWVLFGVLLVLRAAGVLSWHAVLVAALVGVAVIVMSPLILGVVIAIVSRRRADG